MIRERLKDIDIKITELANYLDVSRPTIYKFIYLFDKGEKNLINKDVCQLFDYIESNDLIGKNNVIAFILNNLKANKINDRGEVDEIITRIKQYIYDNPYSEKTQFIYKSVTTNEFDIFIHYLIDTYNLLKRQNLENNKDIRVELYKQIINIYLNNYEEVKNETKNIN